MPQEPYLCRLYLISPPTIGANFAEQLKEALGAGDVGAFQLRLKGVTDDEIKDAVRTLMPIVHEAGAAFIINDRVDLVNELGLDGVHLGQDDMPLVEARKLLPNAAIGVSCHDSTHMAMEAGEAGADYVAFGAFFPSTTKASEHRPEPELLTWWQELFELPCVAIGGITPDNCGVLVRAGADFLAVSQAVWGGDETAAVRAFGQAIAAAR